MSVKEGGDLQTNCTQNWAQDKADKREDKVS